MRRNIGATIYQYIIILVLVSLALIPAYSIIGGVINESLTGLLAALQNKETTTSQAVVNNSSLSSGTQPVVYNSSSFSTNTPSTGIVSGSSAPAVPSGSYPLSNKTPVSDCSGTSCTIDYGDFMLKGIPPDFKGFIEAQGTSGGIDKIAAIIKEIEVTLDDPAEEPIRNYLKELVGMIGTDEWDGKGSDTPGDQLAINIEIYECFAGGSCDSMIKHPTMPDKYYHKRNPSCEFTLPPTQTDINIINPSINSSLGILAENNINNKFDTFRDVTNNVSNNSTGKDYSNYVAAIGALKDYAIEIQSDFKDQLDDPNSNIIKDPTTVDIESIKQNVASKTEDLTAYLMCSSAGQTCK